MKQIFILGASSVYGVGAEQAGWGDLVKSYVHGKAYGQDGFGEGCEVFNFGKAGATIDFLVAQCPWILKNFGRGQEPLILITVGGNDAKAVDAVDGFVSTPGEFREKLTTLVETMKSETPRIVFVSNGYVDESKTNPKRSPFNDGKVSYFTNERRTKFNEVTKDVCVATGLSFVSLLVDKSEWIKSCLYSDGLHPNQAGHHLVFESVKPYVDSYLNDTST